MTRPRIAWIAPYLPAPAVSGGVLRQQHLSRALTSLGDVVLFARAPFYERYSKRRDAALAHFIEVHAAYDYSALDRDASLPRRVAAVASRRMRGAFDAAARTHPFQLVVVAHSHSAALATHSGAPWLLDEHNIESDYVEARASSRRAGAAGKVAGSERREREIAELRAWEEMLWRTAGEVTCVSTADAQRIASARGRLPQVVPNGVDLRSVPFVAPSARRSYEMLFVGAMRHTPNAVAARALALEVLPRVRAKEPRARLVLCGADPPADVRALAGEHVQVTGTVPSVEPYLTSAAVYVNALVRGAGSSLKVVEALASGAPLVSTEVGARGHGLVAGEHYLHAETADEQASAVLAVLAARDAYDAPARSGRLFAERHGWDSVVRPFIDTAERLLTGR